MIIESIMSGSNFSENSNGFNNRICFHVRNHIYNFYENRNRNSIGSY